MPRAWSPASTASASSRGCEGTLVTRYNGVDHTLGAGDGVRWSAGYPHSFRNDTDEPARMVALLFSSLY